jgi:hypothetical protein
MATSKVKGTSKKIKELRGIKPEKITDDQLQRLQKTVNNVNRGTLEIGSLELRKHELMHSIAGFRDEVTVLQSEFEKEYGTYDVDLQTGEINYKEDGKAN